MANLRVLAEKDLGQTLEGEYGLPVELRDPDGVKITTSANDGSPLVGQIMIDTVEITETEQNVVNTNPIVVLRVSSLSRVPKAGEDWHVRIPILPDPAAPKEDFVLDGSNVDTGGATIGFIRLHLRKAEQS